MEPRVGFGYDLHRLVAGRRLVLGGLEIPHAKGLAGHSDGDCLIHAIIDALLGALGQGDIGRLFPDKDPEYKDVSSLRLLGEVVAKVRALGFEISNLDSVVVADRPRLQPYFPEMKRILGRVLGLKSGELSLKAKTNEGIGPVGKGQALACWVVVAVGKKTKEGRKKA